MFVFLKLTLRIKVLNTTVRLSFQEQMELPWDRSSVWTVTTPFWMKVFVKGIIGVLNLTDPRINMTVVAMIVLRDSMGTGVLKKLWRLLTVVRWVVPDSQNWFHLSVSRTAMWCHQLIPPNSLLMFLVVHRKIQKGSFPICLSEDTSMRVVITTWMYRCWYWVGRKGVQPATSVRDGSIQHPDSAEKMGHFCSESIKPCYKVWPNRHWFQSTQGLTPGVQQPGCQMVQSLMGNLIPTALLVYIFCYMSSHPTGADQCCSPGCLLPPSWPRGYF